MGARVAEKLETTERRKNVQKHSSRKAVGSKDTSGALSDATREELIIQNRSRARKLARSILRKWHSRLDLEEVEIRLRIGPGSDLEPVSPTPVMILEVLQVREIIVGRTVGLDAFPVHFQDLV